MPGDFVAHPPHGPALRAPVYLHHLRLNAASRLPRALTSALPRPTKHPRTAALAALLPSISERPHRAPSRATPPARAPDRAPACRGAAHGPHTRRRRSRGRRARRRGLGWRPHERTARGARRRRGNGRRHRARARAARRACRRAVGGRALGACQEEVVGGLGACRRGLAP